MIIFFLPSFYFFNYIEEKKSWLPDINRPSQNTGLLTSGDGESKYELKMQKSKSKIDPYSSKAFHMKYQNPFKVSFNVSDSKDTFKIREQERKKKKQVIILIKILLITLLIMIIYYN